MIRTILIVLMIISGVLLIGSVLLMSPKGGIGFGIGGMENTNEYGSKKSIENTLKKVALFSSVVFVATVIFLPYMK